MRADKDPSSPQRKFSPRQNKEASSFQPRQQQFLDPLREQFKKQCRPSLLVYEQQTQQCRDQVEGKQQKDRSERKFIPHSPRKELKDSVSTTSTYRELNAKTRSCREPTTEPKSLRKEDFVMGALLGKGKFGSVYIARHKKTGFICALKIMSKAKLIKENLMHQLVREVKIQSYCDHPSLTKLYGYFSTLDEIFLITQLSSDGQLLRLIQKHKLKQKSVPESTISSILRQVCEGVRYLHTLKIIHRDIKPENILLERGLARICDFGWAVHHTSSLRTTFCGTPLYVCPQILKGESYDEKVDLWAVGVMAYQMLYGDIPFEIDCEQDLMKIVTEDIVFPESPKASNQFKDFVSRILKKNPKQRLKIGVLLQHPFLQQ